LARPLADVDELRFRRRQREHVGAHQCVVDDDVRGCDEARRADGEQLGVARSATDEGDAAGHSGYSAAAAIIAAPAVVFVSWSVIQHMSTSMVSPMIGRVTDEAATSTSPRATSTLSASSTTSA